MLRRSFTLGSLAVVALLVLPAGASAAASWRAAKPLAPASTGVQPPKVAMDAAGNALAVWARYDGVSTEIRSSRRPFGGSWSASKLVSIAGVNASYGEIAMTPSGTALVLFGSASGGQAVLKSRARSAAGVWGPIQNVSTAVTEYQEPHIAVDPSGRATAVWYRSSAGHWVVQASTRPANGSWSLPQSLSVLTEDAQRPGVAMDAAGNAIVVFARTSMTGFRVQSAYRPAGGAWGAPQDVSIESTNADLTPQVVLGPGNKAIAIWRRWNGTHRIIQASNRSAAGVWDVLPQDISALGQTATKEQLARDRNGNAIAVWQRSNGTNDIIQAASRPVGSGIWQLSDDLSAVGENATDPRIAMNPGGAAIAVWHRPTGIENFVQAARRSAAGAWGATKTLSPTGSSSIYPSAAIDPHGFAVAVWYRFLPDARPMAAVYQGTICTVPKLVGKTLAKAKAALKAAHCRTGTIKRVSSSKPAGRVVSQAKKPGTKLLAGSKVGLSVSRGA